MPERSEPRLGPLGLVLLLAGACGTRTERAAELENPLTPSAGDGRFALDPLGMVTPLAAKPEAEAELPELPFQEVSEGLPPSGSWGGRPLLANFISPEHADLVASNCEDGGYSCWTLPDREGRLWLRRDEGLPRDLGCAGVCAADLDHDGHADLVLSTSAQGLRCFLGDGFMRWREPPRQPAPTPPLADLRCGDLDQDGITDFAGIGYPRGGLQIFYGDKSGGLRPATSAGPLAQDAFGRALGLADLDGDGRCDIAVATDAALRVFLGQPTTPPSWREESQGLPAPRRPDSLTAIAIGRFTADPRPQIAVCSQPDTGLALAERDSIGVYGWNAGKNTWEHIDAGLPRGDRYADLCAADFDGDGKLDLVALSLEHGAAIYLGNGQGGFRAKGRLAGVHGRGRLAVGHLDNNFLPDIVVAVPADKDEPEGGGLRAFLNRRPVWNPR